MVSLKNARQDLARRASALKEVLTGVYYGGYYQGVASGADAARRIISSDLASLNFAGTTAEIPSSQANHAWIWVPSTSEQRTVVANGWQGKATASTVLTGQVAGADSLQVGYYIASRSFSTAIPANTPVELHDKFPVLSSDTHPGLHWAINEALSVMHWPHTISISGVSGKTRYDISTLAPWFRHTSQLIRVFRAETDSLTGPDTMRGPAYIQPDGEKMYLHIPEDVPTGNTFTVQVKRPTSTWILVKRQATASVTVTAGAVAALTLIDGGTGYTGTTATLAISGAGTGASATATVSGGAVTGFTSLVGGSGYVQATTTVAIAAPNTTTWTTSTVGLINDADEALPDIDNLTTVAYAILATRMVKQGPKPQVEEWRKEAQEANDDARPFLDVQTEPQTPKRDWQYRTPRHPSGRSWTAIPGRTRRWP